MKAVLINWDALYRRGGKGRKGSFKPGALDLLSNLIARTPVYIYIERDDKDPRIKAWMKMKGKNIDAIRDRIIWVTAPAKLLANDDANDLSEASEPVVLAEMSEEELHHYDKSPKYASVKEVVEAIKKDLDIASDDDVSVVENRDNIIFKSPPPSTGSKAKKVRILSQPVILESEDAPLLGGKKPKSPAKRAGYGALIAGLVVLGLYAIAAVVIVCVIFLAPPAAPTVIAIVLGVDVALKALGLGGLIASAVGALAALTGIGAGIGALTGSKSTSKKAIELSDADNAAENKTINNTDNVVNSALKTRPPQRPAPEAPSATAHSKPSATGASNAKVVSRDDWSIGNGNQGKEKDVVNHSSNPIRTNSLGR